MVEDERPLVELLRLWFEGLGFDVASAGSGPQGLAAIVAAEPDVVVLDVLLPGYSGFELLRRLRSLGSTVPVILTTALDDVSDREAGLAAGAQDYLTKPYSLAALEASVVAQLEPRPATTPRTLPAPAL